MKKRAWSPRRMVLAALLLLLVAVVCVLVVGRLTPKAFSNLLAPYGQEDVVEASVFSPAFDTLWLEPDQQADLLQTLAAARYYDEGRSGEALGGELFHVSLFCQPEGTGDPARVKSFILSGEGLLYVGRRQYRVSSEELSAVLGGLMAYSREDGQGLVTTAIQRREEWSGRTVYQELDRANLFAKDTIRYSEALPDSCTTPLGSNRAFTCTDPGGETEATLIAEQLVEQLLLYYGQEREGVLFRVTDYRVGAQTLLDQAGLESMYVQGLSPLAGERAQEKMDYFMAEYPRLGLETWCLIPEFDWAWEGTVAALGTFPGQAGELLPVQGEGSPEGVQWVLIRWGEQYWLQRHLAFLDTASVIQA